MKTKIIRRDQSHSRLDSLVVRKLIGVSQRLDRVWALLIKLGAHWTRSQSGGSSGELFILLKLLPPPLGWGGNEMRPWYGGNLHNLKELCNQKNQSKGPRGFVKWVVGRGDGGGPSKSNALGRWGCSVTHLRRWRGWRQTGKDFWCSLRSTSGLRPDWERHWYRADGKKFRVQKERNCTVQQRPGPFHWTWWPVSTAVSVTFINKDAT